VGFARAISDKLGLLVQVVANYFDSQLFFNICILYHVAWKAFISFEENKLYFSSFHPLHAAVNVAK